MHVRLATTTIMARYRGTTVLLLLAALAGAAAFGSDDQTTAAGGRGSAEDELNGMMECMMGCYTQALSCAFGCMGKGPDLPLCVISCDSKSVECMVRCGLTPSPPGPLPPAPTLSGPKPQSPSPPAPKPPAPKPPAPGPLYAIAGSRKTQTYA